MIRLRNPIQAALPRLCAFLLMGIYALELNLTTVNLICLPPACLTLFPGMIDIVNTRKAGKRSPPGKQGGMGRIPPDKKAAEEDAGDLGVAAGME